MTDRQAEEQTSATNPEDGSWIRVPVSLGISSSDSNDIVDPQTEIDDDSVTDMLQRNYPDIPPNGELNRDPEDDPDYEPYGGGETVRKSSPLAIPKSEADLGLIAKHLAPYSGSSEATPDPESRFQDRPVNQTRELGLRQGSRSEAEVPNTREPDTLSQE